MVARSGTVVSARRRMCGHDRNVEGVKQTSLQCCKANTSRLYEPRVVEAGRNRHHQVSATTKFWAYKAQWVEETDLRELRDKVKWYEGGEKSVGAGQTSSVLKTANNGCGRRSG